MLIDKYLVKLTLTRDMLGTNPCDPNVLDTHIIEKQRKLILEKSKINTTVNKYLDQLPIAKEKGEAEVQKLFDKLEELTGVQLTDDEKKRAASEGLECLKETFKELDFKGTTVFLWDKKVDRPCIGDHMILGFLKAATEAICRTREKEKATVLGSISYTQSLINQHVKVQEQFIAFDKDVKRQEDGTPDFLQRSLRVMTAQGPRVTLAKSEVVEAGAKLEFTLKVLKDSPIAKKHLEEMFSYGEMCGLGQWRNAGNGQFLAEMMPV